MMVRRRPMASEILPPEEGADGGRENERARRSPLRDGCETQLVRHGTQRPVDDPGVVPEEQPTETGNDGHQPQTSPVRPGGQRGKMGTGGIGR